MFIQVVVVVLTNNPIKHKLANALTTEEFGAVLSTNLSHFVDKAKEDMLEIVDVAALKLNENVFRGSWVVWVVHKGTAVLCDSEGVFVDAGD